MNLKYMHSENMNVNKIKTILGLLKTKRKHR